MVTINLKKLAILSIIAGMAISTPASAAWGFSSEKSVEEPAVEEAVIIEEPAVVQEEETATEESSDQSSDESSDESSSDSSSTESK